MYDESPLELLEIRISVLVDVVAALAFLALAAWFLTRGSSGRWAWWGAVGASLSALNIAWETVPRVGGWFFDNNLYLSETMIYGIPHIYTYLAAVQAIGALALLVAFVESRRQPK